jgi:hypothetical protein
MIAHVVLMKPRPDLSSEDRRAFMAAFDRALREIPSIRGVRIGRRVEHGAAYEQMSPDSADVLAVIDFDDFDGLATYLRHPAHQQLGALFYDSISSGAAYDFQIGGLELLASLVP